MQGSLEVESRLRRRRKDAGRDELETGGRAALFRARPPSRVQYMEYIGSCPYPSTFPIDALVCRHCMGPSLGTNVQPEIPVLAGRVAGMEKDSGPDPYPCRRPLSTGPRSIEERRKFRATPRPRRTRNA